MEEDRLVDYTSRVDVLLSLLLGASLVPSSPSHPNFIVDALRTGPISAMHE